MNIKTGGVKGGVVEKRKPPRFNISEVFFFLRGAYGTRTRDPMRDRHVF